MHSVLVDNHMCQINPKYVYFNWFSVCDTPLVPTLIYICGGYFCLNILSTHYYVSYSSIIVVRLWNFSHSCKMKMVVHLCRKDSIRILVYVHAHFCKQLALLYRNYLPLL